MPGRDLDGGDKIKWLNDQFGTVVRTEALQEAKIPKRLAQRFSAENAFTPQSVEAYNHLCDKLRLDRAILTKVQYDATAARKVHEECLSRAQPTKLNPRAGKVLRIIGQAAPLVRLMREEQKHFGRQAEDLEKSLLEYRRKYFDFLDRPKSGRSRGNPGNTWADEPIKELLKHLLSLRHSAKKSISAAHEIFIAFGHGDVITLEKIRHVHRTTRTAKSSLLGRKRK